MRPSRHHEFHQHHNPNIHPIPHHSIASITFHPIRNEYHPTLDTCHTLRVFPYPYPIIHLHTHHTSQTKTLSFRILSHFESHKPHYIFFQPTSSLHISLHTLYNANTLHRPTLNVSQSTSHTTIKRDVPGSYEQQHQSHTTSTLIFFFPTTRIESNSSSLHLSAYFCLFLLFYNSSSFLFPNPNTSYISLIESPYSSYV